MKNLTVAQFLNICGSFVFCILTLMFLGFYYASKTYISIDSDFTITMLSVAFVMLVIFVVFVILTIRSFLYPYNGRVEEPQQRSFEELFVEDHIIRTPFNAIAVNDDSLPNNARVNFK